MSTSSSTTTTPSSTKGNSGGSSDAQQYHGVLHQGRGGYCHELALGPTPGGGSAQPSYSMARAIARIMHIDSAHVARLPPCRLLLPSSFSSPPLPSFTLLLAPLATTHLPGWEQLMWMPPGVSTPRAPDPGC